ncbi:MAG: cation:proton antiport protein [Arenimonas sp. SCN 70-307]|uniref:YbaL family putative K(+) efflux transporter n=1 Tax=Arenimonas sp. SCN 70-307 TaxID=1660089 RepID=UPI000869C6F0|nr:YbaL family putative K(+) efflux transporter [Arenimonas sp. SCN 70-307]ODS63071.1 MAG: cation:proton antiport protein [Arenimonas sp. SCN 70-307]
MPHDTPLIALLAVGLVLAFVFGTVAQRLRLSPIVGYLVAGILVGPFTPGFVADMELAMELSEIGVILLMFGVGLHFSVEDLLDVKSIAIPGAIVQITVATVLGWGLAWFLGWPTMQGIVFGLALSVASTVVLLRAMEDRRLLDTRRGKIAVGWLIVEDLVMVVALVLLPALAEALGGRSEGQGAGPVLASLGITLLKVSAFVAVMLLVGKRVIPWMLERVAGLGSRELFTLSVLAIALGVAFGSAKLFGVSFALGAFFAGMLLSGDLSHKAASDSLPLRDAFAVLFFVSVGMLFDPMIVVEQPLPVLATFLIIVLGKSVAAYLIVRAFGHPNETALTISASLAQIGEFSFILAGLGVSLAILPPEGRDLVLAGALLSIMANPLIFGWLDAWQARRLARAEAQGEAVAQEPPAWVGPPLPEGEHAILVGFGRVGSEIARLLRERAVPLVVIDDDIDLVQRARDEGFAAIRGNAANARVLEEAAPDRASLLVLAIPQALEAGEVIARLRERRPEMTILARAHSDVEVRHLLKNGADGAVLAEKELAHSMAEMALSAPPFRHRPA